MSILINPKLIINPQNESRIFKIINESKTRDLYRVGEFEKIQERAKKELEEMGEFKIIEEFFD
ncbi:MAG: hypothetical protein FWH46_03850 [Methanimicrococcus sp.]|nr:hypothetical protein [Methanimicrococcus sp.]